MAYKNMRNKLLVLSIVILLIGIGLGPSISGSILKQTGSKTLLENPNSPEKSIFQRKML